MKRLFGLLLIFILIVACKPGYPPIKDLLIGESIFPAGWHSDPDGPQVSPSAPFDRINSAERTILDFHSKMADATEEIERFENPQVASDEFIKNKDFLFRERPDTGPYEIPGELSYQSPVADQSYFACVRPSYYPFPLLGCTFLAQYGPYIVQFDIGWKLDSMSSSEVERVLQTIDEKMRHHSE